MAVLKRILGGVGLLLAAAGLLLSLAAGVGVWVVKATVTEHAVRLFGRVDAGLDAADQGLERTRTSLGRAAEDLESVRKGQREPAADPRKGRLLARTVQQKVGPEADDAGRNLARVAEAAVIVNSLLDSVGEFPLLAESGLDLERLTELNNRLGRVGPAAWELSRMLSESEPDADAEASRLEEALTVARDQTVDYEARVQEARQRTAALKARTLAWITRVAALLTLVCFWLGLSQFSLLCHAWSWLRPSAGATHPGGARTAPG